MTFFMDIDIEGVLHKNQCKSTLLFQIPEIKSSGQMCAHIVVVYELAEAPPAGPSTHSFLQGNWCVCVFSQKRGPGHGTWATQQNTHAARPVQCNERQMVYGAH